MATFSELIERIEEILEDAGLNSQEAQQCLDDLSALSSALEEKIEAAERASKNLEREKEEVAKSIKSEIEKSIAHKQALDFVKEILTSRLVSDESTIKLYQAIDNIVAFIKEDVQDVLKGSKQLQNMPDAERKALFSTDLDAWAISKKKKWIDGKTTIALLGEFSAGKTSILNCILSNSDSSAPQLPVEIRPTTAISTYISGGLINGYQFVTPNNEVKELSESTFERVSKEILARVEGVSSLIKYFVMTCKNSNLNKFSILDTPGFSSTDTEDAERTIAVINECDALFWVMNISAGDLNESSLAILKKISAQHKPLYIIINQIDLKSPAELQQTERQIKLTLKKNSIAYEGVLHFSKNKKTTLSPLMKTILSIKHDDSRENCLDRLFKLLQKELEQAKEVRQNAEKEKNKIRRTYDSVVQKLKGQIDGIIEKCIVISNKPEKQTHIISPDDYSLSEGGYQELKRSCGEVSVSCDQLKASFIELGELGGKLAKATDAYHVAVSRVNQLEKCIDTLKAKAKGNDLNGLTAGLNPKVSSNEGESIDCTNACEEERTSPANETMVELFHQLREAGEWDDDHEVDDDEDDEDDEYANDEEGNSHICEEQHKEPDFLVNTLQKQLRQFFEILNNKPNKH